MFQMDKLLNQNLLCNLSSIKRLDVADLIAELLLLFEEFKFRKKKKARRKLEEENQLPRKTMMYPTTSLMIPVRVKGIRNRTAVNFKKLLWEIEEPLREEED